MRSYRRNILVWSREQEVGNRKLGKHIVAFNSIPYFPFPNSITIINNICYSLCGQIFKEKEFYEGIPDWIYG
jgi:hypothetical protein